MAQKRRRGTELTEAIYEATREILENDGLSALTFPKVATAAGTSKPVIYRRWDSPFALAIAAVQDKIKLENHGRMDELKLTGTSLRADLAQLLQRFIVSMNAFGQSYTNTFFSGMSKQQNEVIQKMINEATEIDISALDRVLKRAKGRGELTTTEMSDDLKLLPFDWLRYHLFINKSVSKVNLTALIDDVLIPSYRHATETPK